MARIALTRDQLMKPLAKVTTIDHKERFMGYYFIYGNYNIAAGNSPIH